VAPNSLGGHDVADLDFGARSIDDGFKYRFGSAHPAQGSCRMLLLDLGFSRVRKLLAGAAR